jgi:hypothetical protein
LRRIFAMSFAHGGWPGPVVPVRGVWRCGALALGRCSGQLAPSSQKPNDQLFVALGPLARDAFADDRVFCRLRGFRRIVRPAVCGFPRAGGRLRGGCAGRMVCRLVAGCHRRHRRSVLGCGRSLALPILVIQGQDRVRTVRAPGRGADVSCCRGDLGPDVVRRHCRLPSQPTPGRRGSAPPQTSNGRPGTASHRCAEDRTEVARPAEHTQTSGIERAYDRCRVRREEVGRGVRADQGVGREHRPFGAAGI